MKKIFTLFAALATAASVSAQCADVFISEYVEGTQNDKAIELYNPTANPINLGTGQYTMGRDRNGAGVPMLMNITGIIPPYGTRVFVLDKRDPNGTGSDIAITEPLQAKADTFINPIYIEANSPMYFNGNDAFVLVKNGNIILDIVGKIGEDPGNGWSVPGDPNTRWWTEDNTLVRKYNIQGGVTTNPNVFDPSMEWDSLPVNTFDSLGFHKCVCQPVVSVEELLANTKFTIFPNPIANGEFALKANKEMAAFTIFSSNGAIIDRRNLGRQTFQSVGLPQVAPGMYFIEILYTDGSRSQQKLMFK